MFRNARMAALILGASVMASDAAERITYPAARRADQADTYHGVSVQDPYRWLEELDSAETKAWVEAENRVTFGYLEGIKGRAAIKERLTALWNYERYGVPHKEGDRYFFTRNDGLQNQAVLYAVPSLDKAPVVLLDPNTLSKDGTVALAGTAVSDDGKYLAYGVAEAGSDWNTWKVRSVDTATDLPDVLRWVKFSGRRPRVQFCEDVVRPSWRPHHQISAVTLGQRTHFYTSSCWLQLHHLSIPPFREGQERVQTYLVLGDGHRGAIHNLQRPLFGLEAISSAFLPACASSISNSRIGSGAIATSASADSPSFVIFSRPLYLISTAC